MRADTLSLLFELDTDPDKAIANFRRARVEFAREIAAIRKLLSQPFQLPPVRSPNTSATRNAITQPINTPTTAPLTAPPQSPRGLQVDQQVRDFKRIEAEQKKTSRTQEAEQRRLNSAVESLQRQRSAALIRAFKDEERAAVASARAQERAAQQASRAITNAFRGIGPGLQSVGRTLTVGITAPLLALGAVSLKSAKDLDANVNTLKAFTGSAEAAERRLAQLIKTARATPGLTTNLALTLDAQLRIARTTQETIDRVLPAIGRLNAVSKLPDAARFTQNLLQLVTQNFEKQDLKELIGQSPLAGQLIAQIFNVDSPTNAEAIRKQAKRLGLTSVDAFFNAFAEAAAKNQGLQNVTASIGTRFDKIVDRVTIALRPLGLAIINAIEPFIEPVASLIERLGKAFDSLSTPVKTAIIVIAGIAAAAGPVLLVLGSLATSIAGVVSAIGTVAAVVAAVGLPEIALVISGLVAVIGEWVVILGALGLAWKTNFLNIRGLVTDAAAAVLDAFNRVKAVIEEAVQRILPTLQSITTKVLAIITLAWETYGKKIVQIVGTAFSFVVRVTEGFLRTFGNFVDLILKLIDGDFRGAWAAFSRILLDALRALDQFISNLLPAVERAFVAITLFIAQQAVKFGILAQNLAVKFIASFAAGLVSAAPKIRDALIEMLTLAVSGLDPTSIISVLVAKIVAAAQKAASEGVTVPVKVEEQGLARIRLNPDGSLKSTSTKPPAAGGTGTGTDKGADAETRRRIRLLELEAEKAEAIAQQRIASENIFFEQRRTSLKDFTEFQIKEEEIVLAKRKAVLAAERAEAEKLGKGRDLAIKEINLKELKADIEFFDKRNQLLANQEREELEAAKAHRQALLDIQDEGDQKQLELIDAYVEKYLISFEEAEKRRIAIEEKARERRRSELVIQLGEAGQNVEEQQRIKDAIAKIDAEIATSKEESENRKRRALKATLEAELDYYQTLTRLAQTAKQLLQDAANIGLDRLFRRFGDRRRLRLEALKHEREVNEEEHHERLRQIGQDQKDAEKRLEGVRDAEEKLLELRRKFAALEKAEKARRAEERRDEEQREADERDPLTPLRRRLEQFQFAIQNTNDSISESIASLAQQVNESINSMVDALRQSYQAWLIYGDSMGKALKAALAQQLAAISAECLVQALKHAAYAIGALAFGNFAAAAKHAAAAAAFGAAAATTGFGARSLAKSAGLFKGNQATASGAVNGGSEPTPRNRDFQNGRPVIEPASRAQQDGSTGPRGFFGRVVEEVNLVRQEVADRQTTFMREFGERENARTALLVRALDRNTGALSTIENARPDDVIMKANPATVARQNVQGVREAYEVVPQMLEALNIR